MTFSTSRLQLAIYLHADGRLPFLGCERVSNTEIKFVFDDPRDEGDQIECNYDKGASISAVAIFASQKFIRRKMSAVLDHPTKRENLRHDYHPV
jgi:hypothetical protein